LYAENITGYILSLELICTYQKKRRINMDKKIEKKLEEIAKEELFIETLNTRNSDGLDFYDVSVWVVKKALELAFELGREEGKKEK
jgi:hypothetical protein